MVIERPLDFSDHMYFPSIGLIPGEIPRTASVWLRRWEHFYRRIRTRSFAMRTNALPALHTTASLTLAWSSESAIRACALLLFPKFSAENDLAVP